MSASQFIPPAFGLFGVVLGFLLKYIVDRRQSRVQIVNAQLRITSVDLRPKNIPQGAKVNITVQASNGPQLMVDTLFAVEIDLQNSTNRDFATFDFGVSFPRFFYITDEDIKTPDRHHTYEASATLPPKDVNQHERDFRLSPFTRRDRYTLRYTLAPADNYIYNGGDPQVFTLATEKHVLEKSSFALGTPEAGVRFSLNERVSRAAYWRDSIIYMVLVFAVLGTAGSAIVSLLTGNFFSPSRTTFVSTIICLLLILVGSIFAPWYERKYNRKQEPISAAAE